MRRAVSEDIAHGLEKQALLNIKTKIVIERGCFDFDSDGNFHALSDNRLGAHPNRLRHAQLSEVYLFPA
jgi:hypothetical protein